jgi:DNA-binding XRE family transcriptional regulator
MMIPGMIPHQTVSTGGVVTHVLVPVEEYQRLAAGVPPAPGEVEDALRMLADANEPWTDAEGVLLHLIQDGLAPLRKRSGLSQKRLAEALDLSQAQVSRIEKHPENASLRTLRAIAEALVQRPHRAGAG